MEIYETLAQWIYAYIDFIAIEIISVAFFTIDDKNNIKLTFGRIFGDTKYKKTSLFIYSILMIVPVYFFISNSLQTTITTYLITTGWKTIPSFTAIVSFSIFWLTKIILGRKWEFELVWTSLAVLVISLLIIIFL